MCHTQMGHFDIGVILCWEKANKQISKPKHVDEWKEEKILPRIQAGLTHNSV